MFDQSIQVSEDSQVLKMLSESSNIVKFVKFNQTKEEDRDKE